MHSSEQEKTGDEPAKISDAFGHFRSLDRWPLFKKCPGNLEILSRAQLFNVFHDIDYNHTFKLYSIDGEKIHSVIINNESGSVSSEVIPLLISVAPGDKIVEVSQNSKMAAVITSSGLFRIWPRRMRLDKLDFVCFEDVNDQRLVRPDQSKVTKIRSSPDGSRIFFQTEMRKLYCVSCDFGECDPTLLLKGGDVDEFDCTETIMVVLDKIKGICCTIDLRHLAEDKLVTLIIREGLSFVEHPSTSLVQLDWLPCLRVKAIACGVRHTLLLTESGDIYGFGENRFLQLAGVKNVEDEKKTIIPRPVKLNKNTKFTAVAAYGNLSVALAKDCPFLWVWGLIKGPSGRIKASLPFETRLNRLSDVFSFYQASDVVTTGGRTFIRKNVSLPPSNLRYNDPKSADFMLVVAEYQLYVHRSVVESSALFKYWKNNSCLDMSKVNTYYIASPSPYPKQAYLIYIFYLYSHQLSLKHFLYFGYLFLLATEVDDIELANNIAELVRRHLTPACCGNFLSIACRSGHVEFAEEVWRWIDSNIIDVLTSPQFACFPINFCKVNHLWATRRTSKVNF